MFINLTRHEVVIGEKRFPSAGVVRCSEVISPVGEHDGVPLVRRVFGTLENLPKPQEGVIYIVSTLVRLQHPNRKDLASPADLERDERGNVVFARVLVIN